MLSAEIGQPGILLYFLKFRVNRHLKLKVTALTLFSHFKGYRENFLKDTNKSIKK